MDTDMVSISTINANISFFFDYVQHYVSTTIVSLNLKSGTVNFHQRKTLSPIAIESDIAELYHC